MSILDTNSLEKYQDFDIAMAAAMLGVISADEYRNTFTDEYNKNIVPDGMCYIRFFRIKLRGKIIDSWEYVKIWANHVETIGCFQESSRFIYNTDRLFAYSLYRWKSPKEHWYTIEPEYFEHIKTLFTPDNVIIL